VLVELARGGDALLDAALGDLVELDALRLVGLAGELLREVPGDRLAFAMSSASLAAALSSWRTFSFPGTIS